MGTIFFKPSTIKEFLRTNKISIEKYDELLIGLTLSKFHQTDEVNETLIGFKIKPSLYHKLPHKGRTNIANMKLIIDHLKDTYTPIDIVIAFESIGSINRRSNKGMAYQLKSFREHIDGNATIPLTEYLNKKIPKKYAPTDAKLLMTIDGASIIDWVEVQQKFKPKGFPFTGVMFLVVSDDYIHIGELWPTQGTNKYKPSELL